MQTLSRQLRRKHVGGERLPSVFNELSNIGADARRGEILMVVAQPTGGKSAVALWMALKWIQEGLRGIYWSADAVAKPTATRVLSMSTGITTSQAETGLDAGDELMLERIDELTHEGLMWTFDGSITSQSLEMNVEAFRELWGANPDWIVIDNLTDVDTRDSNDEFGGLRAMMRDLNHMVRELNAAGVVLHHVSEEAPENPIPARKFIHGKVSVKPTVVIGTARTTGGSRKPLGSLKNRYGYEDKRGKNAIWVPFNPLTLQFEEVGP